MNATGPFVLKKDIALIPCAELSEDVRERITFDEGDYTLTHSHGRTLVQVIDGGTAALLDLFREPRTIVDAVIENSRLLGLEPAARFEEILPFLDDFVNKRVLVPAGSAGAEEMRPRFESGDAIAGWKVVRCASLVEDAEVYQLRKGDEVAAMKIARDAAARTIFENELEILRRLDDSEIAPRPIADGTHDGRRYIVMKWIGGTDASVAAAQRRHDRVALIEFCVSIAEAYAALHARGVLHVDVHPRNVFVDGRTTLLDFGYSRFIDRPPPFGRGGIAYFYEPEHVVRGTHSSVAGEQYAVAAMLYLLITGKHYVDFRLQREEMEQQIATEPPLPFAARGIPPWPEVERILVRALAKNPEQRHTSMAEMAALLAQARDAALAEATATPVSAEARKLVDATLHSFARGGAMFRSRFTEGPTASIYHGTAGAAVGLLRIAQSRSDPKLLSLADVWRSRAAALIGSADAFRDASGELAREIAGSVTPFHTESGVHAAAAMVAAAMSDTWALRRAVDAFLTASRKPCAQIDLTLGRSGSLLAAAMLLAISDETPESAALRAFGGETMRAIWEELDAHPPIADSSGVYLGVAHGWGGFLYAALRWCEASGDAPPPRLIDRLHEHAAMRVAHGRGAIWPTRVGDPPVSVMPGWCNGSAGQVFLFTLAHRLFGDEQWLRIAELSAWDAWDEPCALASLCCGSAGRAYALLNLYKHEGATEWLSRARQLANRAAAVAESTAQRTNALWLGELGVATLVADLESPENAKMPFFE